MNKNVFRCPPLNFTLWLVLGFLLVGVYLFQVGSTALGLAARQQFKAIDAQHLSAESGAKAYKRAALLLERARRYDRQNPADLAASGAYRFLSATSRPDISTKEAAEYIQAAEDLYRRAIMRDPANHQYHYDLGRIRLQRNACEELEGCAAADLFRRASALAPTNRFLWKVVGQWFHHRDPAAAFAYMRRTIALFIQDPQQAEYEFARFLYTVGLDYQSDLHLRAIQAEKSAPAPTSSCRTLPQGEGLECGNDDGAPEWRAFLTSDTFRAKKMLCVPDNIEEYDAAALKIFMNNAGEGNFIAQISLNEHVIQRFDRTVPRRAGWYDIPFDPRLLEKDTRVTVYIRVQGASNSQNCLQIWGDQDTPNASSVFNFDSADDLSLAPGVQHGEFLIRLILKKGQVSDAPQKSPVLR